MNNLVAEVTFISGLIIVIINIPIIEAKITIFVSFLKVSLFANTATSIKVIKFSIPFILISSLKNNKRGITLPLHTNKQPDQELPLKSHEPELEAHQFDPNRLALRHS